MFKAEVTHREGDGCRSDQLHCRSGLLKQVSSSWIRAKAVAIQFSWDLGLRGKIYRFLISFSCPTCIYLDAVGDPGASPQMAHIVDY